MVIIRLKIYDEVVHNIQLPVQKYVKYYVNDLVSFTYLALEKNIRDELIFPIYGPINAEVYENLKPIFLYENN